MYASLLNHKRKTVVHGKNLTWNVTLRKQTEEKSVNIKPMTYNAVHLDAGEFSKYCKIMYCNKVPGLTYCFVWTTDMSKDEVMGFLQMWRKKMDFAVLGRMDLY